MVPAVLPPKLRQVTGIIERSADDSGSSLTVRPELKGRILLIGRFSKMSLVRGRGIRTLGAICSLVLGLVRGLGRRIAYRQNNAIAVPTLCRIYAVDRKNLVVSILLLE
jgi:hypothetical protein